MKLENLEIYKLSREINKEAWKVYSKLSWQDKKIMGDQFITAVDSIGANVAEACLPAEAGIRTFSLFR